MSAKGAYFDNGFALSPHGGTDRRAARSTSRKGVGAAAPRPKSTCPCVPQDERQPGRQLLFARGLGGSHELKFGFSVRECVARSGSTVGGSGLVGYLETASTGYSEILPHRAGGAKGTVSERLPRRRLQQGPPHAERRPALRPPVGQELPGHRRRQRLVSRPRARARLPRRQSGRGRVELALAPGGIELRARRVAEERAAGVLRVLRSPGFPFAWVRGIEPGRPRGSGLRLDGPQRRQVRAGAGDQLADFRYSYGIDRANPTEATSPNRFDPDWAPQRDHEVVLGIDHELVPGFAVGAAYTWRRASNYDYRPWLERRRARPTNTRRAAGSSSRRSTSRTPRPLQTATAPSRLLRAHGPGLGGGRGTEQQEPARVHDELRRPRTDPRQTPREALDGARGPLLERLDRPRRPGDPRLVFRQPDSDRVETRSGTGARSHASRAAGASSRSIAASSGSSTRTASGRDPGASMSPARSPPSRGLPTP